MAPPGLPKKAQPVFSVRSGEKTTVTPVVAVEQLETDVAGCGGGRGSKHVDHARERIVVPAPKGVDLETPVNAEEDAPEPTPPSVGSMKESGRERLKRHRSEVAGRVWIPETWGHETLLRDWKDCSAIDRSLFPAGLLTAREALVEECRRASSGRVRIGNSS